LPAASLPSLATAREPQVYAGRLRMCLNDATIAWIVCTFAPTKKS
jgi:hypothetical protein